MDKRVNIPVSGRSTAGQRRPGPPRYGPGGRRPSGQPPTGRTPTGRPTPGPQPVPVEPEERQETQAAPEAQPKQQPAAQQPAAQQAADQEAPAQAPDRDVQAELESWRDQSLRLQAEMDNFRRRQRQRAQDEIDVQQRRLLGEFLRVVDDLERALSTPASGEEGLREGIQLTRRTALQLMEREGVERIEAEGQAFDPEWHEAVATVRRVGPEPAPNTVVQVIEPGYRLRDQLLRPAKVIVAV